MADKSAKYILAISSLFISSGFAYSEGLQSFDALAPSCVDGAGGQSGTPSPGGCSDYLKGAQGGGSGTTEGAYGAEIQLGITGGAGADASPTVKGGAGGGIGRGFGSPNGSPGGNGGDYGAGGGGGGTPFYYTDGIPIRSTMLGGIGGGDGELVEAASSLVGAGSWWKCLCVYPDGWGSNTVTLGEGLYKGGTAGNGGSGAVPGLAGASGTAVVLGGSVPMTLTAEGFALTSISKAVSQQ